MTAGAYRESRRRFALTAIAMSGGALGMAQAHRAAAFQTPAVAGKSVSTPSWLFGVDAVQDPYPGTMQAPAEAPPGTRVIAVEVEISNDSDQALAFTTLDVRLRDQTGMEYRGGGAIGSEPMINPRNLNPGERSRGWVWFIVPAEAVPVEVVYVAPPPQLRVPWPG